MSALLRVRLGRVYTDVGVKKNAESRSGSKRVFLILYVLGLWAAFGSFMLKLSTTGVDANFGPLWLSPNIFTTYLEAWAWSGCVSAAFANVIFSLFW